MRDNDRDDESKIKMRSHNHHVCENDIEYKDERKVVKEFPFRENRLQRIHEINSVTGI